MLVPNRHGSSTAYRYGFNGKEKDDELKGEGNAIDYEKRFYDPRIGKFLSLDPLIKSFPWYSPYQFAGNKPIWAIDLDGEEEKYYQLINTKNKKGQPVLGVVFKGEDDDWYEPDFIESDATILLDPKGKDLGFEFDDQTSMLKAIHGKTLETLQAEGALEELGRDIRQASENIQSLQFMETIGHIENGAMGIGTGGEEELVTEAGINSVLATKIPNQTPKSASSTSPVKNVSNGRSGKQARLREWKNDPKASKSDRGWLKNDQRHIETGNKNALRIPRNGRKSPRRKAEDKGYELAHPSGKGQSASAGNGYSGSKAKNAADHKTETRIHQKRYKK
ncbi:RHS repeat-associated core domain-containing protein [Flavobacterium sp.]|uniref:RHS repeat-associated core domain-containing protein n=1 Tax=Flavobacterium sp. TaxID=239 RepID=UPI00286E6DEA|nr:RHS repeat-associated core domain-containing protein [Flavobacterium sp.]